MVDAVSGDAYGSGGERKTMNGKTRQQHDMTGCGWFGLPSAKRLRG